MVCGERQAEVIQLHAVPLSLSVYQIWFGFGIQILLHNEAIRFGACLQGTVISQL